MTKLDNVLEVTVEDYLVNTCEGLCGVALKVLVKGRRGFPDRLCILPGGVVFFVELKRPKGGRVAPLQTTWHKMLSALGVKVFVCKTKDEVDEAIREIFPGTV